MFLSFLELCVAVREMELQNPLPGDAKKTISDLWWRDAPEKSVADEKRLAWLRSQIVGNGVQFNSPFGKRMLTYADHTASSRSLLYIESFILNNVLPFYGNTHTSDSYVGHRTTKMLHEASEYIKKSLGGKKDDAIMFCGSGTTASIKRLQEVMGIAVPSIIRERVIKCLSKEERWVVFVGPYEHHSNLLSWRQSLGEVVDVELDENGLIDLESLEALLESYSKENRPMLGSFSACSNVTGLVTDTRAISRLMHSYGGFVCFDFASSGPYVEIEMRSGQMDGYDGIFVSPHKFVGGPGSPGVLLISKALYQLKSSPPSTCGGGTVSYVNPFNEKETLYVDEIEERENGGTPPIVQTIRAAMAFWIKEYVTLQVIERKETNYIDQAIKRLKPNKNIWILGNTEAKRLSIFSFIIYSTTFNEQTKQETRDKPLHGAFVATLLNDLFGIQSRGGCACAAPYGHFLLSIHNNQSLAIRSAILKGYNGVKPGWTRISFPYYMANHDFEFIIAAVEFIASYGQRFLPLYKFNLKSGIWSFNKKFFKNLLITQKHHIVISRDDENELIMKSHKSYLQIAKYIANLLPKFPSTHKLPQDVDPNLLYFRI